MSRRRRTSEGRGRSTESAVRAITLAVRVRPGASRTSVGGVRPGPYGSALIVSVGERAVEGRANDAVIRALAEAFDLPRRCVRLRLGHQSRDKIVVIEPAPEGLADRVAELLAAGPAPLD